MRNTVHRTMTKDKLLVTRKAIPTPDIAKLIAYVSIKLIPSKINKYVFTFKSATDLVLRIWMICGSQPKAKMNPPINCMKANTTGSSPCLLSWLQYIYSGSVRLVKGNSPT